MNLRYLPIAVSVLAWTTVAQAVRPRTDLPPDASKPATAAPTAAATPASDPGAPPPAYELKNRSSFTLASPIPRPPFWPIGWVHHDASAPLVQAPVQMQTTLDKNSFKVTSILLGSGTTSSYALINGRSYGEGESIRVPKPAGSPPGSPVVRVHILQINDGSVVLQYGEQKFVVPLRREEVASHADEKLLTDQDRDDQDPAPAPIGKATVPARPAPTPQRVARP